MHNARVHNAGMHNAHMSHAAVQNAAMQNVAMHNARMSDAVMRKSRTSAANPARLPMIHALKTIACRQAGTHGCKCCACCAVHTACMHNASMHNARMPLSHAINVAHTPCKCATRTKQKHVCRHSRKPHAGGTIACMQMLTRANAVHAMHAVM